MTRNECRAVSKSNVPELLRPLRKVFIVATQSVSRLRNIGDPSPLGEQRQAIGELNAALVRWQFHHSIECAHATVQSVSDTDLFPRCNESINTPPKPPEIVARKHLNHSSYYGIGSAKRFSIHARWDSVRRTVERKRRAEVEHGCTDIPGTTACNGCRPEVRNAVHQNRVEQHEGAVVETQPLLVAYCRKCRRCRRHKNEVRSPKVFGAARADVTVEVGPKVEQSSPVNRQLVRQHRQVAEVVCDRAMSEVDGGELRSWRYGISHGLPRDDALQRDTQSRGTSISEKFPKINDERQDGYFEARFDLGFVRVKQRRRGLEWTGVEILKDCGPRGTARDGKDLKTATKPPPRTCRASSANLVAESSDYTRSG